LIHESKGYTIIEIHTGLGWRMGKFSSSLEGINIERNAKTVMHYSKQLYRRDKHEMDLAVIRHNNADE